jgi:predicted site-specific integrase-resolvase
MEEFVSGINASKILGVHQRTLYLWDKKKIIETIRTPGGKRLYNVKKYLKSLDKNTSNVEYVNNPVINSKLHNKNNYIYARVSSLGQKNDLE